MSIIVPNNSLKVPRDGGTGPAPAIEGRAYPSLPDLGDGRYHNPVLAADYSDPDVIRDGDDFYLTASSFNCVPGLPIVHSRDLVNWRIVNHALPRLPHSRYDQVQHGCGVWAPAIRRHAGTFWIFFATPDEGIYFVTADHPTGRWSEPHLVASGRGLIDPCPLWDDDGRAYLIHAYAFSRSGIRHKLRLCEMAPDGSRLLAGGQIVVDGAERHPTLEGPKFLKRDGYYYVLAPAGGVPTGWQVVFRSRNIHGPYEEKVVLGQGATAINGPHQGALVDTSQGEWWFLHFQERQPFGRVVHLQPVRWQDGWPLMGCNQDADGVGEPVLEWAKPKVSVPACPSMPQDADEFEAPTLGLQWQWQANPQAGWFSLTDRPGHLRLFARGDARTELRDRPNLLLQKLQACSQFITTKVHLVPNDPGVTAGLIVTGLERASLALRPADHRTWALVVTAKGHESVIGHVRQPEVELGIVIDATGRAEFRFRANDGDWQSVAGAFRVREGVWIGAKVGLFTSATGLLRSGQSAACGYADFSYFRVSPPDDAS